MESSKNKEVLISGASFAGLCTAYWMSKSGYKVTVVEIAKGLRKGGTPVNILGHTIEVVRRMGILKQIISNNIPMEVLEFKNAADVTERADYMIKNREEQQLTEYEIPRDVLLDMLFDLVNHDVEFLFDESIVSMIEESDHMQVTFKSGVQRSFHLVFGCDGIHSAVRKLWFGEEPSYLHFLKTYFSITIVNKLLIPEYTIQMYNEPGKMIMLNAYNNKTDIVLCFSSEDEIPYDYRNETEQRNIILKHFQQTGWRTPELLQECNQASSFYFDKLCQVRMPSWTKGRVALVGDAGYCPSPAAGRGGSLAIDGAAALAEAFQRCNNNYELAFQEYNNTFRPFIEEIQTDVVNHGLETLIPLTEEAIRTRNEQKEGFGF